MASSIDPSSLSNLESWTTKSISLCLTASFDSRELIGSASIAVSRKNAESDGKLCLDTRDLSISSVECNSEKVEHRLHPTLRPFGEKLEIDVSRFVGMKDLSVKINYSTSPKSTALQWMSPAQTRGKKHPYMYSQCQFIHARSLLPCQDSPSVKATYSAQIETPAELVALMSAVRLRSDEYIGVSRKHYFEQKVPVPSYLIAIVIGNLKSRRLGPRSSVWSEPEMVDEAAYEFSETEDMLRAGERLCGPYVWGVYDLLVLPPSFPYGGMENPCLTFVTPTLLAGDRSLSNVVAHEIAHSWTGNLVTNVNWEHFWLNEGHTVYVERKMQKLLNGEQGDRYRHLYMLGGRQKLMARVKRLGEDSPLTALVWKLDGIDPNDALSSVPYEKGSALLYYIETLVGEKLMEKWLLAYVDHFKSQPIDTTQWKDFLYSFFQDKIDTSVLHSIDWGRWFSDPGYIINAPELDSSLADAANGLASEWSQHKDNNVDPDASRFAAFSPKQRMIFLDKLKSEGSLDSEAYNRLTKHYSLHTLKNAAIRFRWLSLGLEIKCPDAVAPTLAFLNEQGRIRYNRSLYSALGSWSEKRELAVQNFNAHREFMHPITAQMVTSVLGL